MALIEVIEVLVEGPQGPKGELGGLPDGGTTGQVATKASDADGDVIWANPAGGGGGAIVINEYEFTQTTDVGWAVTNIGASEEDFLKANIEVMLNGVKLRKEGMWVDTVTLRVPQTSVKDEDFLVVRVTTTTSTSQDPVENEFTQDVANNGGIWTVAGIGNSLDEFDSPKLQVFYNGVKLRKGTQAVWVSPTELRVFYTSVQNEDYLTIRTDA